jgi:hypothetical protein
VNEARRARLPLALGVARGGGLLEGGLGGLELPVELEQRAVLELGWWEFFCTMMERKSIEEKESE